MRGTRYRRQWAKRYHSWWYQRWEIEKERAETFRRQRDELRKENAVLRQFFRCEK